MRQSLFRFCARAAAAGAFAAACLALATVSCSGHDPDAAIRALNDHSKHIALNMDCATCHVGARDGYQANLPPIGFCALCHRADKDYPPTPEGLKGFIRSGKEVPWPRRNRLAGHVFFSHVAHVRFGGFDCVECHESKERPVVRKPNMWSCIDCHLQHNASVDCLTCHR